MRVTFPIIRTLAYAALVFFMWRFVGMQALRFDAKLSFALPGWTTAIGIPLLIAGVVLTTICLAKFALIGKGTFVHFDPPKEFIASGVYRFSRNPMYLGVLLIFIASGLIYHSVSLLILSLLLFSLAHLVVVFFEEPALRNKFGESYTAYEDAVGRWLPKVKK